MQSTDQEDILIERPFLGICLHDPKWIDMAVDRQLNENAIHDLTRRELWKQMLRLRVEGKPVSIESLVIHSPWSPKNKQIMVVELMACDRSISNAELHGKYIIDKLIWRAKAEKVIPTLLGIKDKIEGGADQSEIVKDIEDLPSMVEDHSSKGRNIKEICDEAEEWAKRKIAGTESNVVEVTTGLPTFDRYATHIQPYEYTVVCARTSHGKTSFMEGMAGHNLRRGLRVAYFTIESSDRSVIQQIAAQYANVNLRFMRGEVYERQKAYFDALKELHEKPFLVFDKDVKFDQIQAKCRMLVSSFQPDVVFLDYLNIIGIGVNDSYEQMSALSAQMIPLKKMLGCALVVGAQLNRGSEKEGRRPERTDLRDSGSLEEDAHRIIALYRPKKNRQGMEQTLGQALYEYEVIQLKCRDGPLASCDIMFDAPHTKFYEAAKSEVIA